VGAPVFESTTPLRSIRGSAAAMTWSHSSGDMNPCHTYARGAVAICSIHCLLVSGSPSPSVSTSAASPENSAAGRSTSPSQPIRRSSVLPSLPEDEALRAGGSAARDARTSTRSRETRIAADARARARLTRGSI
jgi:hypothetical protein